MNQENMKWATEAFEYVVWPEIRHWFPGGALLVPGEDASKAIPLDVYCGIDWFVNMEGLHVPIAVRIVDSSNPTGLWACFTMTEILKRSGPEILSELKKRQREQDNPGAATPYYTIQAFVNRRTSKFEAAGKALTRDILRMVDDGLYERHINKRTLDVFLVVKWREMREQGLSVATEVASGI